MWRNIRDFLWWLSLILCAAEHYSNTRDPHPPLLFPWEMHNNLSGGQMKHGLWLQGDSLSFLRFIFHLPVKLARMAHLKWESGKVVFVFTRQSALLWGFRHNEGGGGGGVEKYLRLLPAQGMSGGASRQENTLRLTQWGHITSIVPQHVRHRGTIGIQGHRV